MTKSDEGGEGVIASSGELGTGEQAAGKGQAISHLLIDIKQAVRKVSGPGGLRGWSQKGFHDFPHGSEGFWG